MNKRRHDGWAILAYGHTFATEVWMAKSKEDLGRFGGCLPSVLRWPTRAEARAALRTRWGRDRHYRVVKVRTLTRVIR